MLFILIMPNGTITFMSYTSCLCNTQSSSKVEGTPVPSKLFLYSHWYCDRSLLSAYHHDDDDFRGHARGCAVATNRVIESLEMRPKSVEMDEQGKVSTSYSPRAKQLGLQWWILVTCSSRTYLPLLTLGYTWIVQLRYQLTVQRFVHLFVWKDLF